MPRYPLFSACSLLSFSLIAAGCGGSETSGDDGSPAAEGGAAGTGGAGGAVAGGGAGGSKAGAGGAGAAGKGGAGQAGTAGTAGTGGTAGAGGVAGKGGAGGAGMSGGGGAGQAGQGGAGGSAGVGGVAGQGGTAGVAGVGGAGGAAGTGGAGGASVCANGAMDGDETDVDCGGSCPACADGKGCSVLKDCASFVCTDGKCQAASCTDGVKNGTEFDKDCGGGCPKGCEDGTTCSVAADCLSGLCIKDTCKQPSCSDGQKDGLESDIDCGGFACLPCVDTKTCGKNSDCQSGYCNGITCATPTCSDEVVNGDETDIDCGGSCSSKCADGANCKIGNDCVSGQCIKEICTAMSCMDQAKDGKETDVDCGGGACPGCETGKMCLVNSDCAAGNACAPNGTCQPCDSGASCAPEGTVCQGGTIACDTGVPVCHGTGPLADGTSCQGGSCTRGGCAPDVTIMGTKNLSTDPLSPGRACAEGIAYSVAQLSLDSVTLSAQVGEKCLAQGDLAILINLQGADGHTSNVGNYEIVSIASVSGTAVTLTKPKTLFYGADPGTDTNIGSADGAQRVILQRIPVLGALAIPAGATLTANPWDGQKGGVFALRVASIDLLGSIQMSQTGYRGGRWSQDTGCLSNITTERGESIAGPPVQTTDPSVGASGGIAAGNVDFNGNTPLSASAGHATAGQPAQNTVGLTVGGPGVAYGKGDGSLFTLGSGPGGNVTCTGTPQTTKLVDDSTPGGGIVALYVSSLKVGATGVIHVDGGANRGGAASGGYLFVAANQATLGMSQVSAIGGVAKASVSNGTFTNSGSDGYVVVRYSSTIGGQTSPAANATQDAALVLP